jgi:hypothetical protein
MKSQNASKMMPAARALVRTRSQYPPEENGAIGLEGGRRIFIWTGRRLL